MRTTQAIVIACLAILLAATLATGRQDPRIPSRDEIIRRPERPTIEVPIPVASYGVTIEIEDVDLGTGAVLAGAVGGSIAVETWVSEGDFAHHLAPGAVEVPEVELTGPLPVPADLDRWWTEQTRGETKRRVIVLGYVDERGAVVQEVRLAECWPRGLFIGPDQRWHAFMVAESFDASAPGRRR